MQLQAVEQGLHGEAPAAPACFLYIQCTWIMFDYWALDWYCVELG